MLVFCYLYINCNNAYIMLTILHALHNVYTGFAADCDITLIMADKNKSTQEPPVNKELFEKWLPIFKDGVAAKERLSHDGEDGYAKLTRHEKAELRRKQYEGEKAFAYLYERIMVVASVVVKKELEKPRAFHVIIEESDLNAAAYEGIYAGLMKLDLDKMKKSSMNLIMQYVTMKVSREALRMEASVGISPSKLRLFKKIAAVRRSMREQLGYDPTDEEVLEYFHSGKADYKTMNGKAGSNQVRFKSNAAIRLKDIQDQRKLDDGHPFHTPITDEKTIDASISIEDNDFQNAIEAQDSAQRFWNAYMDYIGIPVIQQAAIISELKLYDISGMTELRKLAAKTDEKTSKQITRDFIKLVQNEAGCIQDFSKHYMDEYGEGFWHIFAEDIGDGFKYKTNKLHLKTLIINPPDYHNDNTITTTAHTVNNVNSNASTASTMNAKTNTTRTRTTRNNASNAHTNNASTKSTASEHARTSTTIESNTASTASTTKTTHATSKKTTRMTTSKNDSTAHTSTKHARAKSTASATSNITDNTASTASTTKITHASSKKTTRTTSSKNASTASNNNANTTNNASKTTSKKTTTNSKHAGTARTNADNSKKRGAKAKSKKTESIVNNTDNSTEVNQTTGNADAKK